MQIDLSDNGTVPDRTYDVCIIGAGAAGITLAIKLAEAGKSVALCEGGQLYFTGASQDNYIGEVIGDSYFDLDTTRLRYFGGSTNHWGGMSRMLDEIDFQRDYLGPEFVWPIDKSDLDPYFAEACDLIEVPSEFDDELLDTAAGVQRIDFKFSEPVRFADKFLDPITNSSRIDLLLSANFVDLDGAATTATSAVFSDYEGNEHRVNAGKFVFAMGGIENSRMLLWLRERHASRFFDDTTPLGQYWMEHPHFALGEALVGTNVESGKYYALTAEVQRDNQILNCMLEMDRQGDSATRRMVRDLLCVAPGLGERMAGLANRNLVCGVRFKSAWEQAPNPSNRIELSDSARDQFGIPSVELHWRKRRLDRETVVASSRIYNDWLLGGDLGRIRLDSWLLDNEDYPENAELAGNHHMGGTRMGSRRDLSVVDENCLMHGSKNLYAAGSSVFTTSGHANPTLPILQMTLRLADHLST